MEVQFTDTRPSDGRFLRRSPSRSLFDRIRSCRAETLQSSMNSFFVQHCLQRRGIFPERAGFRCVVNRSQARGTRAAETDAETICASYRSVVQKAGKSIRRGRGGVEIG